MRHHLLGEKMRQGEAGREERGGGGGGGGGEEYGTQKYKG